MTQLSSDFLRHVEHKLKAPLTTINLYSEGLLTGMGGTISSEQKEYLEEIHRASTKAVQLIDQLLGDARRSLTDTEQSALTR